MEKDQVSLQITALTKVMEDATYSFTSTINALKTETDQINQENRKFEMEIENKILFANSKFSEYGKIVLAIRNLDILSKSWVKLILLCTLYYLDSYHKMDNTFSFFFY